MNLVENFIVKQPTIFSGHSQITCWFRISQTVLSPVNSKPQIKTHNLPKQFIWEQNSNEKFLNAILLDEFQSRLLLFEKSNFIPDSNGIDIATSRFSSILNDISLRSLRLSCSNKTPTKRSSKKWFDKECAYLRKKLTQVSSLKHNNPYNENIRNEYHKIKKNFKKLIKYKKSNLANSKIDELTNPNRNQNFWTKLKELNGEYQNKLKQDVPVDNLYNHFNNLYSAPELSFLSDSHISVINEKYYLEQQKCNHNYLDNPISLKEVEIAAKMLKYKKSPGPDRIRNEMLKTGIFYLKTSICNLFNLIFKSGFFPSLWCEGIITPIHKSGDTQDPSNYRGICINSCLGKLFTSILNNRLQNHRRDNNILHHAQIGFLPNHRTSDHIFTLRTLVDKFVTHTIKGKLYTCFI